MREQENINDDILKLTPEELEENIYKNLTSNNPQAAENIVEFSFKERKFKLLILTMASVLKHTPSLVLEKVEKLH